MRSSWRFVNTLRPILNGRHHAADIFKFSSFHGKCYIFIWNSLNLFITLMIVPAQYFICLNWVSNLIGIQLHSWWYYHGLLPFDYWPWVNTFSLFITDHGLTKFRLTLLSWVLSWDLNKTNLWNHCKFFRYSLYLCVSDGICFLQMLLSVVPEGDKKDWYTENVVPVGIYVTTDSRFASTQWETALLCNDVSHWLGASLESALLLCA